MYGKKPLAIPRQPVPSSGTATGSDSTMRAAIIVLAIALIVAVAIIFRLRRTIRQSRRNALSDQESINRAAEVIRSRNSVIEGAVLAFAALRARFEAARAELAAADVDTSALDAALADTEPAAATLAAAIAEGTPAESEVDGIGDEADTIVPEDVDTSEITALPEGGQDGGGTGGDE
jgi:hypothetical protein